MNIAARNTLEEAQMLVRHYRKALNRIVDSVSADANELRRIAKDAWGSEARTEHHPWCAQLSRCIPIECDQCAELWRRYPSVEPQGDKEKR